MKKTNGFFQVPSQVLLNDSSVKYSGFLEKKTNAPLKPWVRNYVIISNGDIYIYKSNTASKPCFVSPLSVYSQVIAFENQELKTLWMFALKPLISSLEMIKFAAPSQREMNLWIKEMNSGIILSNSLQLQRMRTSSTLYSNESYESDNAKPENKTQNTVPGPFVEGHDHFPNKYRDQLSIPDTSIDDGNMYDDSDDIITTSSRPLPAETHELLHGVAAGSVLTSDDEKNIYEEPQEMSFVPSSAVASAPPIGVHYPSLDTIDVSSFSGASGNFVEMYMFYGTRYEAAMELQSHNITGTYLVRSEHGRQILSVRCDNIIVKFILCNHPENGRVYIKGQKVSFESMDQLVAFYHEHPLPNQGSLLSLPYTHKFKKT